MDDKLILARAMPPPVDVAVDGFFAGKLTRELKQELRGWVMIAVSALALAGLIALLVLIARIPGIERVLPSINQNLFNRVLVGHVTFGFVVWYVAIQGALTVLVTAGVARQPMSGASLVVGRLGLLGAVVSFLLLLAPVVGGLGTPSPNNYIPVMSHPVYYIGLALLGASVALPIVRLLAALARLRHAEPMTFGVAAAGVMFLLALLCFSVAWCSHPEGFDAEGLNDFLMWGGGHVLQFVNTALFLSAMYLLTRVAFGETPLPPAFFKALMLLLVAGAAVGPLLYATFPPGDPTQRMLFTGLYRYALPLPTTIVCVSVVMLLWRRRRDIWPGAPEVRGLAVALVLFGYGGVLGFLESSVDTRTPAHYHGMLIAVTLMFIALIFAVFLPLLDRRTEHRRMRSAIYLMLALGTIVQITGLFTAGWLGVARKVAGGEQGLDTALKRAALDANAVGGGVAAIGGVLFIVLAARMLLAKQVPSVTGSPR